MEQAILEHLDQLYWDGYGEAFRAENPQEFQSQLTAFICEHAHMVATVDRRNKYLTKSRNRKNGTQH